MDKSIKQILNIMEDMPVPGTTSVMSGAGAAQDAQEVGMDIMPGDFAPDGYEQEEESCCPVTPDLIQLATDLVRAAGSADRAREVIDKVDDVQEVLDIDDEETIAGIADMMPVTPDLPNNRHNELGMSAMFDPGGNTNM
jgi:hypothetical protein